jgi:membrane-bound metal-dependent hydrolase YbcI (DUF457 family)
MGPIGHIAIGFAAKPVAPKIPLWILLAASETLDLLCFGFVALGIETNGVSQTDLIQGVKIVFPAVIPWSHGLVMSLVWSVIAAAMAYLAYRDRLTSVILGGVVFSHWILDFFVHLPDLPLLFNSSPRVGLGLWGSGTGLVISGILEFLLCAAGFALYWRARRSKLSPGKPRAAPVQ